MDDRLTAKGLAPLKSGRELGPHVDEHVLVLLQLLPPFLHRLRDHGGYRLCVIGVEDITHPLLVQMMPVLLIGRKRSRAGFLRACLRKSSIVRPSICGTAATLTADRLMY